MGETVYQWFNRLMFGNECLATSTPKTLRKKTRCKKSVNKKKKYVNRHAEDRKNLISWMRQEWQSEPYLPQYQMAKKALKAIKKGQIRLKYPKSLSTIILYSQYADPLPRKMRLNRAKLNKKIRAKNV